MAESLLWVQMYRSQRATQRPAVQIPTNRGVVRQAPGQAVVQHPQPTTEVEANHTITVVSAKLDRETLLERMNSHSPNVQLAYDMFKEFYHSSVKPTFVSDIINGEVIETKPDNILVDDPIDEQYRLKEESLEKALRLCTKKLYKYQLDAIRKIRELELRGTSKDGKIVSNGWLLSLPIGSGKSLVFQFLSIFYPNVPKHPIVISRDGRAVTSIEQAELKIYPFYYENCGYDATEESDNAVVVLEDYIQRPVTVILTHQHLLTQMKEYFETDFPLITKKLNIHYLMDMRDLKGFTVDTNGILVVPSTSSNMEALRLMSYEAPFSRVIIDDYTSMPGIESFRQIRASSTLFVSGSGFNRREQDIPASYYTLKFMPVPKISLVGKPEETFEGIFRDSIATMELIGSNCKFSQYKFVGECEEYCRSSFRSTPTDVYPLLRKDAVLHNYIALMFVLKNLDRIKSAITNLEHDIVTINPKTNKTYLDKSAVRWYFEWKEMLRDSDKPVSTELAKTGVKSMNPLFEYIYSDPSTNNATSAATIPDAVCMHCGKEAHNHNCYGMIATCCGAFFCSDCMDEATTTQLISPDDQKTIYSDKYYCTCCRRVNPRFHFNAAKKKDSNVSCSNLIEDHFDTSDVGNTLASSLFDYFFYSFMRGWKPLKHMGRGLSVKNDIDQGVVDRQKFLAGEVPVLDSILPKDQLAILAIKNINDVLTKLKIVPKRNSLILYYGCPQHMQERVVRYQSVIRKMKTGGVTVARGGRTETIQPIFNCNVMFKSDVGSLIGLHENIIAIIAWETPTQADERNQLFGRLLRLNSWGNPLTFYISTNSSGYE